jgi:hypothetical protein
MNFNTVSRLLFASLATLSLAGCTVSTPSVVAPVASKPSASLMGKVLGGQQPVSGATLQLYAVSNAGYYQPATPLFSTVAKTNQNGEFTFPAYSCADADQVYLVGTGGNPGLAGSVDSPSLALMTALGSCANLLANQSTTYINVNELTTVAAAWSLSHFMSGPANAGTSPANAAGLVNAFAAAAKVVDTGSGGMPGSTLPRGATLPDAEINTLADILATCINSDGSTQSAASPCSMLFAASTPAGGSTPADTITAALNIARFPANNVTALYQLATPTGPYQPALAATPDNWLLGIHYIGGGLNKPGSLAIDAGNNLWATNSGANTVSEFANSGAPISSSAGYSDPSLAGPSAVAIDASGNAWIANAAGNSITMIGPRGTSFASYADASFAAPSGIAIDGFGNLFIANKTTATVTELSSSGSVISATPYSGAGLNLPIGIAIDSQ